MGGVGVVVVRVWGFSMWLRIREGKGRKRKGEERKDREYVNGGIFL